MAASAIQELIQDVDNQLNGSITIVVLGASGDLAKKKTFPSLFGLYRNGFLPKETRIIGYARTKMERDEFVKRATEHIKLGESPDAKKKLDDFLKLTSYHNGQYNEDASWEDLARYVEKIEGNTKQKNRLFYVALPPSVFLDVASGVRKHVYSDGFVNRIVIEKPFGKDLDSSRELGTNIAKLFKEEEIYRIDHYLGKEMVKNLMTLRFANVLFGQIWDSKNIDNVQITFKEPFGTEGRGGYFDEFGIIRDVMQNHLLQVLSLVAMERPTATDAESIRDEKVKVLRCIEPIKLENALLGQYVGNGEKPGYKEDDSLKNKDTNCPTFAALVAYIHNDRWEGVPFIMKAGKALNEPKVEIRIQFRNVSGDLFKDTPRNELVLRIQPSEAVYMKFNNKHPGLSYQTLQSDLDLTYHRRYSDLKIPDAYEALILDVLRGDHSNFVRDDELDAAWKIFTPILHEIEQKQVQPKEYKYGGRGPAELDDFVRKFGYDRSGAQNYEWPVKNVSAEDK